MNYYIKHQKTAPGWILFFLLLVSCATGGFSAIRLEGAYNGFTDRNMKAKALFMAAKCEQKQAVDLPNFFSYGDMKEYNSAISKWVRAFDKKNKYFSTLGKDYNNTAFYKEAIRTCSFLKDFIIKGNRK